MNKESNKLKLKDLFEDKKLRVPSYQRAYAWEEPQLKQFVSDMLEICEKENGQYYFGHFIMEKTNDYFEIIDGQQRITTFILFLMTCRSFNADSELDNYINKFETVGYDQESFKLIQEKLNDTSVNLDISSIEQHNIEQHNIEQHTLSIKRILYALDFFKNAFNSKKELNKDKIDGYVQTFLNADISKHITYNKAVAVQIFELQNTRGVKLNLIEKVKSKLMKEIYLNSQQNETDDKISIIQKEFARIYQLEEQASSNAFRGDMMLEDILLHHLRIIDDGSKQNADNSTSFSSPSRYGNKEELILNYINQRISKKSKQDIVDYITNLSIKFGLSVELVSIELPKYDKDNSLVGDVLILDKFLSLEFFILLFHSEKKELFNNDGLIKLWEKLLFTRDFHNKYYRQVYRDDFDTLFYKILKDTANIESTINTYINTGFRNELMEESSLQKTVSNFITNNEDNILKNAFHWFNEKIIYVLYKYEISQNADLNELRNIMKKGCSVEHILPQSWQWSWIDEKEPNKISEKGKEFNNKIESVINGLGNLLLLTPNENSSEGNKHPKDKNYESCTGGSYDDHNHNKDKWEKYTEWENIIEVRGQAIFLFLKNYFNL